MIAQPVHMQYKNRPPFLIGRCVEDLTLTIFLWVSSTISVNKRALTCSKPINLIRGQVCQLAMSGENQYLSTSSWCSKHSHPSKSIVACELLPGGYCNMVSINTLKCPSTRNWTLTAQSVLCRWSWPLREYDVYLASACAFTKDGWRYLIIYNYGLQI